MLELKEHSPYDLSNYYEKQRTLRFSFFYGIKLDAFYKYIKYGSKKSTLDAKRACFVFVWFTGFKKKA